MILILFLAGGHGIIPISWKRYWCVLKDAKFYCYKTSFDSFADYILLVKDYTIESITEKKKMYVFNFKELFKLFKYCKKDRIVSLE